VLQVHADYTLPSFQSKERMEQVAWLGQDAQAAVQAGMKKRTYDRLILIGKSIGTLSLAYLVAQAGYATATSIWVTPLLRQPVRCEPLRPGTGAVVAAQAIAPTSRCTGEGTTSDRREVVHPGRGKPQPGNPG
jgi:hypothetical protein